MNTTFHRYATAGVDRAESAVPSAKQRIEITGGEISTNAAGELLLHFGPVASIEATDTSGYVAGGQFAAGGGSARFKRIVGPLGVGLFSSDDSNGTKQTVGVHYEIVTVKPG